MKDDEPMCALLIVIGQKISANKVNIIKAFFLQYIGGASLGGGPMVKIQLGNSEGRGRFPPCDVSSSLELKL